MSYGAETREVSQTRGFVRYLRRHHHTTSREILELREKLQTAPLPDFDLNLSRRKTTDEVEKETYEAVPSTFE